MRLPFGRAARLRALRDRIAELEAEVAELETVRERTRPAAAEDAVQRVRETVVERELAAKRAELAELRVQLQAAAGRHQRLGSGPALETDAAEAAPSQGPSAFASELSRARARPALGLRSRRRTAAVAGVGVLLALPLGAVSVRYGAGPAPSPWVSTTQPAAPAAPTDLTPPLAAVPTARPGPAPAVVPPPPPPPEPADALVLEPQAFPTAETDLAAAEAPPEPTTAPVLATGRVNAPGFTGVNLHTGPSISAPTIRTVPNGTVVQVLEYLTVEGSRLARVRTPEGLEGWMLAGPIAPS